MGEYIAKSLPVQLDALTRTTRVSVDENIITTFKEINTEHDSIKSVWEKSWESVKDNYSINKFQKSIKHPFILASIFTFYKENINKNAKAYSKLCN
jgi:hypothetical protein